MLRDLKSWMADGYVSGPAALVVSDSRYPSLGRLAELEEREVVFYDRDGGYAKALPYAESRRLERKGVSVLCGMTG